MPSYSDFKYLQKMNAKSPQISDEKKEVLPLWHITFDLLKLDQKLYIKEAKLILKNWIKCAKIIKIAIVFDLAPYVS